MEKKIKMQLEGLDLFEKVVKDIVKGGLAAVNGNTLDMLEEQGKTLNVKLGHVLSVFYAFGKISTKYMSLVIINWPLGN